MKIFWIKAVAAFLLSTLATIGVAQDRFALGSEAYGDGLYAEAADHWLQAAQSGHGPSQFNLGILYEQAQGVAQDYAEALKWYTLAAKNGLTDAAFSAANILLAGTASTERSVDQAIYWYVQAADAGHAQSQFELGTMFVDGKDVPEDMVTGISWLELAAENHHIEAISLLSRLAEQQKSAVLGEDWLASQHPDLYTIELYSAPTLAMAHEFVLVLELKNAAIYASAIDRYHVVVGAFNSDASAQRALDALPVALRARVPKIRRFGVIHEQLQHRNAGIESKADSTVSSVIEQSVASVENDSPPPLFESVQINDDVWIKSRNPDRYTAVLFSDADESKARSFATKTGLSGGAIYKSTDGMFRVLGGLFENEQEAQNAIARLPQELQALSPRPMRFSQIFLEMAGQ